VTEGERVTLTPLDAFGLPVCHFIKADLEGMEGEFLEGAKETIAKCRPVLYMEADGAQKTQAIRTLFEWGYRSFWHVAPLFNLVNFAGNNRHVFLYEGGSDISSVNMLCVPGEAQCNIKGLTEIRSPDEDGMALHNECRMKEAAVG
jgi:hypothetical protein